jgi:diadenosine tetraphosphate (Ap4A) HIT family hydrolase
VTGSDIFPFEGDLLVKSLRDPVLPEPPRLGEAGQPCPICAAGDAEYLWTTERWRLRVPTEPRAVPVFILESRRHLDLEQLDDDLAAELGALLVRVVRAVQSVDGVGRAHVNRWGDGAAHLHVWFLARPEGMLQLRGSCLPDWLDALPALPDEEWQACALAVRAALG